MCYLRMSHFLFWYAAVEHTRTHAHAHTRTHTRARAYTLHLTTRSPVVSVELKGQQMTGCTFKMAVRVPSSVNASTRAQTEMIQEPRQLRGKCRVDVCQGRKTHSPEHVATSHGNECPEVQERRGKSKTIHGGTFQTPQR